VRTMRAADEIVDAELVEPLMLTAGK